MRCVCDIGPIYELRIKNISESDPRSCEATKAVAKKTQKKNLGFNILWLYPVEAVMKTSRISSTDSEVCVVTCCLYISVFFLWRVF